MFYQDPTLIETLQVQTPADLLNKTTESATLLKRGFVCHLTDIYHPDILG